MVKLADVNINDIVTVAGLMGGTYVGKVVGIDASDRGGVVDIEVDDADSATGKSITWAKISQVVNVRKWSRFAA